MSLGRQAIGRTAIAAGLVSTGQQTSVFQELVTGQHAPAQFLVDGLAFKGISAVPVGKPTIGGAAIGRFAIGRTAGGTPGQVDTVEIKAADQHWVGDPDDGRKPNEFYEGLLLEPIRISAEIPTAPEQSPRVQRQIGSITFADALGSWPDYAVDGRDVTVRYGPHMGRYNQFGVVWSGVATGWRRRRDSVELLVRDARFLLQKPLQRNLYEGTGGAEGTGKLTDKPKPVVFGKVRNIALTLIDPTNLIYQAHDGAMQAFDAVYDQGLALTNSGTDVADYSTLAATSVASGEYATALSVGLVKLGSSPAGQITADVRGDASGDGYVDAIDKILERILVDYAEVAPNKIDQAGLDRLGSVTGVCGWYIDPGQRPSSADVIDRLVQGVGGYWGGTRDGRLTAGVLIRPESEAATFYLDENNVVDVTPQNRPRARFRQRVEYRRNWTVQTSDLAGALSDDRRQELAQQGPLVEARDDAVRNEHPEALDPAPLRSPLDEKADAQALANSLLARHKRDREEFLVTVKRLGFVLRLAQIVELSWPRYGLSRGKRFAIVGMRDTGDTTELILWG